MGILISAKEVIDIAFCGYDQITPDSIKESKIKAAELAFIKPVFGAAMYDRMAEGELYAFVSEYIRPALAYYVRYTIIPDISVKLSNSGAGTMSINHQNVATDKQREISRSQAKTDADAFINLAVEYVETHPDDFPEYQKRDNIRNRTLFNGGFILR